MIDKMFQQEILNAELRKTYYFTFLFHDIFASFFPDCTRYCLPPSYIKPEECGGTIFQKLMGIDKSIEINDLDILNHKQTTITKNTDNMV